MHAFRKASLLTNLYVSLGACGLCYAVSRLQGIGRVEPFVLIAFLYVQSMHILNHLTGGQADRFNEPERARFYHDRRVPLTVIAFASGAAGLDRRRPAGRAAVRDPARDEPARPVLHPAAPGPRRPAGPPLPPHQGHHRARRRC